MRRLHLHILSLLMMLGLTQAVYATFILYEDAPEPINPIAPVYPGAAIYYGIEGQVILEVDISAEGTVDSVRVYEPLDHNKYGIDESAVAAAKQWKFDPGRVGGKPTATTVMIPIQFTLDKATLKQAKQNNRNKPRKGEIKLYLAGQDGLERFVFHADEPILLHYEIVNYTKRNKVYWSTEQPGDMCKLTYEIQPVGTTNTTPRDSTISSQNTNVKRVMKPAERHEKIFPLDKLEPGEYVLYITGREQTFMFPESDFASKGFEEIHFSVGVTAPDK